MSNDARAATPRQIANRYGISVHKVLRWIAIGELRAINVATDMSRRPRWVVPPDALADFERRRAAQPRAPPRRRKRRGRTPDVIEFF